MKKPKSETPAPAKTGDGSADAETPTIRELPSNETGNALRKQLTESNGVLKVLYNYSDLSSGEKETIGEVIDRNTQALKGAESR